MNFGLSVKTAAAVAALAVSAAAMAAPANFSFAGNFVRDDNVQLINFTADGVSTVSLVSYSYGGGTQVNGNVVARGGFDPILALFNATTGALIGSNDDAAGAAPSTLCGGRTINADAVTGQLFDVCFDSVLVAGNYIVSVMQYDNFSAGLNLSNGFLKTGQANFTTAFGCSSGQFCDVSGIAAGNNRTGNWALDILGVEQAAQNNVPEPSALALVGLALAGLGLRGRARSA